MDAQRGYQTYRYGEGDSEDKALGLYLHDNHYDTLTSFQGILNSNHFCFKCLKAYDREGLHRCTANKDHCPRCCQDGCENYLRYRQSPTQTVYNPCDYCGGSFYGPVCYQQHQTKTYQGKEADATHLRVCQTVQYCRHCGKRSVYHGREMYRPTHKCHHFECPSCKECVDLSTHRCFIHTEAQIQEHRERQRQQRRENAEHRARAQGYDPQSRQHNQRRRPQEAADVPEEVTITVYFDIEAMQVNEGEILKHEPNLMVAATTLSERLECWPGPSCIRDFVGWLDRLLEDDDDAGDARNRQPKKKILALAHNFQGYDSYFIIQEYHRRARDLVQNVPGGKVLELKVGKTDRECIRFIDSLSFLPMALDNFTDTFGLSENDETLHLKKGFFPHFFNTPENQNYRGPLPSLLPSRRYVRKTTQEIRQMVQRTACRLRVRSVPRTGRVSKRL